jgi:GR25 family glycosyltransferase involved in LPS biosynthesis
MSPRYRRNNSQIIDRSFSKQYEFSTVGWGEAPTTSILNRTTLSNEPSSLDWPKELGPVLVLSIRPERMKKFEQRMGPWMKHMRRFPATDGRLIDPKRWYRERRVVAPNMAPGRLGCYDTHVRIWETIANSQHPIVTVLEDDVDFDYYRNGHQLMSQMKERIEDVKHVNWEFLAWGHGPWAFGKNTSVPGMKYWKTPGTCQGFFAYTLTRDLARKLVQRCRPYKGPAVDKWFYDDFIKRNHIKALTAEPRLCWVVDVVSDTNTKKMRG